MAFASRLRFRAACCIALLVQAACSSAPTQYYRLPDSTPQVPEIALPAQETVLLTVRLSESVAQNRLLYQESATAIHPALSHLWLNDIGTDIAAALANRLNRLQSRYRYTTLPETAGNTPRTLTVYIDAFQGRYDGNTQIAGYTRRSGQTAGSNFDIRTPQTGAGYAAMVQSLAQGLDTLAAQIARL